MRMLNTQFFLPFLAILFIMSSCSNDDSAIEPNATYYFTATVDGKTTEILYPGSNDVEISHSHISDQVLTSCNIDYSVSIQSNIAGKMPMFDVDFMNYYQGECEEEGAMFNSLFQSNEIPFYMSGSFSDMRKVNIVYHSEDGVYSTAYGDNSGGKFQIISSSPIVTGQEKFQLVEASVTCRLYKRDDPTDVKMLDNGKLKLSLSSFNN